MFQNRNNLIICDEVFILKKVKVLTIFGTRPEAIKMAPLIKELESREQIVSKVLVTAQHRDMLDQVLDAFDIVPDYDLNIMQNNQTLEHTTTKVIERVSPILEYEKPDIVLVHGDTTTTFASALAASYKKIKIGHVEAGLRTYNKMEPFPEEMNRCLTDVLSDLYFVPTEYSKENLKKENTSEEKIYITGNTAIDAIKYTVKENYTNKYLPKLGKEKLILVTMHRRENIGDPMKKVFKAIARTARLYPNVKFVFPMHKNPAVREIAIPILGNLNNVVLLDPLDVWDFHNILARSHCVLTDSGGIQEEAPSFGIPVLVLRNKTERPEGVKAGVLKLIGTEEEKVYCEVVKIIESKTMDKLVIAKANPYGDGNASRRITDVLLYEFGLIDWFPRECRGNLTEE